jgi:serine/threonine protein kinase/ABC-type transport system substrate-binding protein
MRQCPKCAELFADETDACPRDRTPLGAPDPMLGHCIDGKYRIEAPIGRGAMGAVYRATQLNLKRPVAIKIVRREALARPAIVERFEREALTIARLKHPSIITIHDFGVAPDVGMYIVMEFLEGRSLRSELNARGPLPVDEALAFAATICSAAAAAHRTGVIHRDLKPDNIFLETSPDGALLKVLDFGIAKLVDGLLDTSTTSATFLGTAAYASPEQCQGDRLDERSDIYSIGCILFEMVTGRAPFVAEGVRSLLKKHIVQHPSPPSSYAPGIPEALDAVVLKALAKDPSLRYQTASEVEAALGFVPRDGPRAIAQPSPQSRRRVRTMPLPTIDGDRLGTGSRSGTPRVIGRRRELTELERRLELAREGECHGVFVAGGAGVGKSRLVEEFERIARERGAVVLHGRLAETDHGLGFDGFCEVVETYLSVRPEASEELSDLVAELVTLFPVLAELEPVRTAQTYSSMPPDPALRVDAVELLARTFARIAGRERLVLAFEDLHLAGSSIDALHAIVRRLAALPVLVVATYRPAEIAPGRPLASVIDALRGDRRFAFVDLEPLAPAEVRALAETTLELGALSPELEQDLYEATGGDPFFTAELVRAAIETRRLTLDDTGVWHLEGGSFADEAPESVRRAVAERLDKLPEHARSTLGAASALGRSFEYDDLAALDDSSGDDLEKAIERLVAERFLREERRLQGDRFVFVSGAAHTAIYASLPGRTRRGLHRRFAEHLERRASGRMDRVRARLVEHYRLGENGPKTAEHAFELARAALGTFDGPLAESAARTALEAVDGDDLDAQGRARRLLASAFEMSGRPLDALSELQAAVLAFRKAGRADRAIEAMTAGAALAWESHFVDEAKRWLERGLGAAEAAGERAALERLVDLGLRIANLGGDRKLADRFADESARLATPSDRDDLPVSGPSRWGAVHMPIDIGLRTLEPYVSGSLYDDDILSNVFETLLHLDASARPIPWLAAELRVENEGKRYWLRLRDGVRFHDGSPMTARDVRASFERLIRSTASPYRQVFAPIRGARAIVEGGSGALEGVRCLSDSEIEIEIEQPLAFFPALLANGLVPIVPERLQRFDATWRDGCVGTGPFRVARFEPGARIELEANPDYWRPGFPRLARLVCTAGVSPDAAYTGFLSGRYSLVAGLARNHREALIRDSEPGSHLRAVASLATASLYFNIHTGPFADESVRRRFADAIDVERLVLETMGPLAVPARSLIPPGLLGYEPEPRRPRSALESATRSVPVRGTAPPGFHTGAARGLRARLVETFEELGFRLTLDQLTADDVFACARAEPAPDVMLAFWFADYPDADSFAYQTLHCRDGNVGPVCGLPEIDRLAERARSEPDLAARHRIYREVEATIAERRLLLPLYHPQRNVFAAPDVTGLDLRFSIPTISYDRLRIEW